MKSSKRSTAVTEKVTKASKRIFKATAEQTVKLLKEGQKQASKAAGEVVPLAKEGAKKAKKTAKQAAKLTKLGGDASAKAARKAAELAKSYAKRNPSETKNTLAGLGAGAGLGYAIGGAVGVVAFGGGVGIPIVVLTGLAGTVIGNRLGVTRDKQTQTELLNRRNELLKRLVRENNRKKIKQIATPQEHRNELIKALKEARHTLCILSGWATSYAINKEFKNLLRECLMRGVNVYIGYGYTTADGPRAKKSYEREAENNLRNLGEFCLLENTEGTLVVREYPNHTKLLICDEKYAINGSFNWLSNMGRSSNEERSWIVYDPEFISTELDLVIDGLMSPKKATKRDLLRLLVPWADR